MIMEWLFWDQMMLKMCCVKWVALGTKCITFVTYSIIAEGKEIFPIKRSLEGETLFPISYHLHMPTGKREEMVRVYVLYIMYV